MAVRGAETKSTSEEPRRDLKQIQGNLKEPGFKLFWTKWVHSELELMYLLLHCFLVRVTCLCV